MSPHSEVPMISADQVSYRTGGAELISGASFELSPGTLTALVGPNGAGKSTMLALLAGDLKPTEGTVSIQGSEPRQWRADELARRRSVMLQQHSAHFGFSVSETVAMGRLPHAVDRARDHRIVEAAIDESDLRSLRQRDVTTLSGGESARASFARTSAQDAPLVLLDEPTAALDLRQQEALLRSARRRRDEGAAVVVVLHDLNLASRYADRVLMFARSRLVADGSPAQVLTAERVHSVYGQQVHVLAHPETGAPVLIPVHDDSARHTVRSRSGE